MRRPGPTAPPRANRSDTDLLRFGTKPQQKPACGCGLGPNHIHIQPLTGQSPQTEVIARHIAVISSHPRRMRQDDEPIRGQVRARGFRRVSHGLFLVERPTLSDTDELHRELRAWLAVLPPGAVFTHVTGARLLGWRLPHLPEQVPVFAAVHSGDRRPRRVGLLCSRLVPPTDDPPPRSGDGDLPVDQPEEILLRAARDLGHLDLVVMIDSARASGDLDPDRMAALLRSRRPGTRPLAAAYHASDVRAESAGETILRRFHDVLGIPVEPQAVLRDSSDHVLGRADLLLCGRRDVHEYDGAGHRTVGQHRSDLRRDRRLAQASYSRRGFTLDDLVNHAAVTMHELDRLLGREHRPGRLRSWHRMIEQSLYSETGRQRVLNRWRRAMGVVDWS